MARCLFVLLLTGLLFGCWRSAPAEEIGYVEEFALSQDRAEALKQLIPGTEDWYYYQCLHLQHTEQFDKVDELLDAWIKRHRYTPRVNVILNRQALLLYERDPQRTLKRITDQLNLKFNHQREVLDREPNLPTAVDPKRISREMMANGAYGNRRDLSGFEDRALDWLISEPLNDVQRRDLVQRLRRPDHKGLPKLIVDELKSKGSPGFGKFAIHNLLLPEQLKECLKLKPDLLNQMSFVTAWLQNLQSPAHVDWQHDSGARQAYFDRIQRFVQRLAPVHNSLKAHVLYHQLLLDRSLGKFDRDRFLAYIRLPRQANYVNPKYLERPEVQKFLCNLGSDFSAGTLLPPVGNDEPLVRDYLHHFFLKDKSWQGFGEFLRDDYLKRNFAETKIVNELGDKEEWASLLTPEQFRQLRERVDIDFAPANRTVFAPNDPVTIEAAVKNVETLIVKVFHINAFNYYRDHLQEVNTDIDLDGLVANSQKTEKYDDSPLHRVTRKFKFPGLTKPGVYVIDLIGNGRSSRVLIRKGRLRYLVRTGPAGQIFSVLGHDRKHLKDTSIWHGGRRYNANDDGFITVPFTNQPGREPLILTHGDFATLDFFQHEAENYALAAGIHVDRESLLTGNKASVILRPSLRINGIPVTLSVLKHARLTIQSTDQDDVSTSTEVDDLQLFEDRETEHQFQVPPRLKQITFELHGNVRRLSDGFPAPLAVSRTFVVNQIEQTDKTEDLHLACFDGKYVLELLGRSGESLAKRPIRLTLKHRDFRRETSLMLQTNDAGRVMLGNLPEIVQVKAKSPQNVNGAWTLPRNHNTFHQTVHGVAGQPIVIPYSGSLKEPVRGELSLLERRGSTYVTDRFDALQIKDGLLQLDDLPAGEYSLLLKETGTPIQIRLINGDMHNGYVLGPNHHLEIRDADPLQIAGVAIETVKVPERKPAESVDESDDKAAADPANGKKDKEGNNVAVKIIKQDQLHIRLQNTSKFTRVHVVATQHLPAFSAYNSLSSTRDPEPFATTIPTVQSSYAAGRRIGDELRYIIDRKLAKKFPGNTLQRPSLLLNPWSVRSTQTGQQQAQAGNNFARDNKDSESSSKQMGGLKQGTAAPADFSQLDFLADASLVLTNLQANEDGVVAIPLSTFLPRPHIQIIAVDPQQTVSRTFSLPQAESMRRDLRLPESLAREKHYTQQKQITVMDKGDKITIDDLASSRFESLDSLSRIYWLFVTLSSDDQLQEFDFVLEWPKLEARERLEHYSTSASHELNFFLYHKDRDFFDAIVRPYLANKQHKTFLDDWLLNADLSRYREPWQYRRLNAVERVLLSQRLKGESQWTQQLIGEQFALLPVDRERSKTLFETALGSRALDADNYGWSFGGGGMGGGGMGGFGAAGGGFGAGKKADLRERNAGRALLIESMDAPAGPPAAARSAKLNSKMQAQNRKELLERQAELGDLRQKKGQPASNDKDRSEFSEELYYDKLDQEVLKNVRKLYQKLEQTQEWAENNYYQVSIEQQNADLVDVNAFWNAYAAHDPNEPFRSRHFTETTDNLTEMMLALAVLDLPFEAGEHKYDFDRNKLQITAASPLVLFHQEIREANLAEDATPVLVSQNFYRQGDRHRTVNGQQVDKYITVEFLTRAVYGCQVAITNPTSTPRKLDVLFQVPQGAIPVLGARYTKSVPVELDAYATQTIEYHFYFPETGKFPHYPVQVSNDGRLIAHAAARDFNVVDTPSTIDRESWDFVSQQGTDEEVLTFLRKRNLLRVNMNRIAFRMSEARFFRRAINLLDRRHVYNHTLWSYSVKHNDPKTLNQYVQHANQFVAECGSAIASPLLTIDPIERRTYQQLDYSPLVNARAHQLGKRRQILNDRLYQQYHRLLDILSCRPQLDDEDRMAGAYYLLLQDRVEEAMGMFEVVDRQKLASQIQYDYFAAWIDLYSLEPTRARAIVAKYVDYPVERWRSAFAAVGHQLDEAEVPQLAGVPAAGQLASTDGDQAIQLALTASNQEELPVEDTAADGSDSNVDLEDRDATQSILAKTEPTFDFTVEAGKVDISYQNLKSVRVNYYEMDIELLFSRNPFVQRFTGSFSWIRPNATASVALPADATSHSFGLPEQFGNSNFLVEIVGAGQTKTQTWYSHSLNVQIVENYGQLVVTNEKTKKSLPRVYVKVYAAMSDGSIRFYKDGYTDLRGRFDYSSLNTNELDSVRRFSVLILSKDHGAIVREAAPPKQ